MTTDVSSFLFKLTGCRDWQDISTETAGVGVLKIMLLDALAMTPLLSPCVHGVPIKRSSTLNPKPHFVRETLVFSQGTRCH